MKKRTKKIVLISTGIFFFLIAWIVLFGGIHVETKIYDALYPETAFSSDKWKESNPRQRGRMLYDLMYNVDIEGKTGEEIIQLLGEPDEKSENEDSSFDYSYKVDLGVRDIGVWPFCDIFYYSYTVKFNPEGLSKSYSLNN